MPLSTILYGRSSAVHLTVSTSKKREQHALRCTLQGKYAPSSSDSGSTGSLVFDYYWGMELYPRIGRHFDLKTWTNCRMGMMGWGVLVLCYAVKQYELYGHLSNSMAISILLMHLYIFKFFL